MELLKDYDCTIYYHPGKANVVADALSRKSTGSLAYMQTIQLPLMVKLRELGAELRSSQCRFWVEKRRSFATRQYS